DGLETACVRTPLGPAAGWDRAQWTMEVGVGGGQPLRTLGDVGTTWTIDERIGVMTERVALTAGLRIGIASCGECFDNGAVLGGPAVAATFFPFTRGRTALAVELSYASLFEVMHLAQEPSGTDPTLREWYQVPGLALQWEWLAPPRGSRV